MTTGTGTIAGSRWLSDLIRNRHSVRSYLPDPVPEDVIRDVFDVARWSPSNNNSQPWHVAVVSGAARDSLEQRLLAAVDSGQQPEPAFAPSAAGFDQEHQDRAKENASRIGALLGISHDDSEGRARQFRRNYCFYDAPHAAFYSIPRTMGVANGVDLGLFIQTVVVLMASHGIGTCVQGSLALHPGPVAEIARVPEGHGIVCGMSFGYPDPDGRINQHRSHREALDSVLSFQS